MPEEVVLITWSSLLPPAHTLSVPPRDPPAAETVLDAARRSVTRGSRVVRSPPSTSHSRNVLSPSHWPTASEPRLQNIVIDVTNTHAHTHTQRPFSA